MDGVDDFAGAAVIDEEMDLPGEVSGAAHFQLTGEFAPARRNLGVLFDGLLRTEAAIEVSALRQA